MNFERENGSSEYEGVEFLKISAEIAFFERLSKALLKLFNNRVISGHEKQTLEKFTMRLKKELEQPTEDIT